jgi:hypothetical protein
MAKANATEKDEVEIVEELGAEPVDPEDPNGLMEVEESRVLEEGAVDAESIRSNRRARDTVNKRRAGQKHVPFNDPNVLLKYEQISLQYPVSTMIILVKRLTGTEASWTITSQPRNAQELYAELKTIHGRREETTYEVVFRDSHQKQTRGQGRITLPSTLDQAPVATAAPNGQPPMNPYYPYGSPAPAGAQYMPHPQTAAQVAPAPVAVMPQPAAAPQVIAGPPHAAPSAGMDWNALLAWQRQQFEFMQQVQQAGQQPRAPQAQAAPPPIAMPPMPAPPPSGPAGMDMASLMEWQKQLFAFWQQAAMHAQQTSPQVAPQAPAPPPPAPQMNAQAQMGMMGMPPVQPPPGTMFVPGFGFVPVDRLFQALTGAPPAPSPPYRGGGRPQYGPRAPSYAAEGPRGYAPEPPRPRSAAEELRDSLTLVRTVVDMGRQFTAETQHAPAVASEPEEDDSPVRVIDAGPAKLVINRDDGTARYWETGWANMDKVLKWIGEQREAIQKANSERADRSQKPRLPPGYVEVTPGYRPPPGFVAVPVNPDEMPQAPPQAAQELPPPPAEMPRPIHEPPAPVEPAQRRTWGMPSIPGQGPESP